MISRPGNEERADAARAFFVQQDGGFVDAAQAANARTDQNAGAFLVFLGLGLDARILDGLGCRCHGIDDEGINFTLILHVHPFVRIVLSVRIIAQRKLIGDLAGDIIDLEVFDALRPGFAGENIGPSGLDTAPQRGNETQSR